MIRFIFDGDSSKLKKAADDGKTSLKDLRKEFREGVTDAAKWGAGIAAAGLALGAHLVNKAREAIDEQAKLAQQLRTTSASMAALNRAGDLAGVSMDKITMSGKQLDIALGRGAQGGNAQAATFARLKLSADELSRVPLDQRILMINKAIAENIPATERAAIAAELFGAKNASAMQMLDEGTLARAREETELFGLALTEIDVAKVEAANDSFSRIQAGADGFIQQMAVQLSPVLDVIGQQFFDTAKEAGGMGNIAAEAMEKIVNATAFVIDVIAGIKRSFELAADGGVIAFEGLKGGIIAIIAEIVAAIDKIPGVDLSGQVDGLREMALESIGIIEQAKQSMDETLMEPLPGGMFKDMVEQAKVASEEAARIAVEARAAMAGGDVGGGGLSEEERKAMETRLQSIRDMIKTEEEILNEKYAKDLEALNLALENQRLTEADHYALSEQLAALHDERITEIHRKESDLRARITKAESDNRKKVMSDTLNGLTSLMNSENKKMFNIGKAAAISQAVIDTYKAATGAYSALASIPYVGPALGAAAAAAAIATGFANVQAIRSQQFGSGGGAAGSVTQQVSGNQQPVGQPSSALEQRVIVQGLDPDTLVNGRMVMDLFNSAVRNGARPIFE